MGKLDAQRLEAGDIDLRDDLVVAAHWMLGKLTVVSTHARALAQPETSEAERMRRRREVEDALAKCTSLLSDMVRGLPPDLAKARLSGR